MGEPLVRCYVIHGAIAPRGRRAGARPARGRGRQLAQVMPTVRTPYAGPPCVPLWTNPSGKQVISFCGGHGERYDHGHLSRVTLHPPMYGMNFGAAFAW